MKRVNLKKVGISMVALVITIIVLIILTAAVVITGMGAPKKAQLAVFYSNIDTVQELVNITMGNNMIEAAQNGYGTNYKWTGIVEGYGWDVDNRVLLEPTNPFEEILDNIIGEGVEPIQPSLLEKTTIADGEKYYVGQSGKVYYEGFEFEGKTYYNKDTKKERINNGTGVAINGITADDVYNEPTAYYGAYVNYTQANGEPFKGEEYIPYEFESGYTESDLEWRIFYSDGDNIYLTTKSYARLVEFPYNEENNVECRNFALNELRSNKDTYKNETYAEWARDGITCEMFMNSYNDIAKAKGVAQYVLLGNEEMGYEEDDSDLEPFTGTLQENLYFYETEYSYYDMYWLASPYYGDTTFLMDIDYHSIYGTNNVRHVINIGAYDYSEMGIRPIVCLKSDVELVETDGIYTIVSNGRPDVKNDTITSLDTITIKAKDNNGIVGYAVTNINTLPTSFTSCTSTTTFTQVVDGLTPNTTYYVWVKDIDGNVSAGKKVKTAKIVTREDIVAEPTAYYGAYVNYTQANGEPFKAEDGITNLKWRIFHADETNIYLTTKAIVGTCETKGWSSITEVLEDLQKETYKNEDYAEWSRDGITYEEFNESYSTITGNEISVYSEISTLSGLQTKLYRGDIRYWLASMKPGTTTEQLVVGEWMNTFNDYLLNNDDLSWIGIRPIVCLKSNVQLVGNDDVYNIVLTQ